MDNGVFDNRLEDEFEDLILGETLVNIDLQVYPVVKAKILDLHVCLDMIDLIPQADNISAFIQAEFIELCE